MAINTQKFLPAPKGGTGAKISQKNVSTQGFSSIFSGKTIKNIGIIKVKVIQIEKILKGTIALEKKSLDDKKRKDSGTRREKQEEKLETKPNVEKGNIKMPSAPRLGILDWVKNFIGNIILGYFAVRLIDHLPKIMPIVKFLGAAADFIIDIGGKLLNGLVTFIDWGYKAYDATRGFIKNLGGENFAKGFDKFAGLIDTALFLTTVLAGSMAIEAMTGDGGSGGPGGDLRGKPKPGTGGRPKVTTTGGGGAGKPDIRNPLRQKPKVTTGGGGKFKIPSGSSIKAGGIATLVMLIPDLISSGMLISQGRPKDGIRTFLSAVAAVGAGMAAIAGVTAGAAALGITGVGLPAAIALAIAGFAASSAASFLAYEGTEALLKKMGLVDNDPKTGKPYAYRSGGITRGGKTQGRIKRTIKKPKRTIRTLPSKIKPGQSIGGEKNIKKIFPEVESKDKGKKINPYGYMKSSYEKLSSADAFGGLFALPLKAQLGEEPSKLDYKNAASGLNSWMQRTFSSEIMRTGGVGFAEGGSVNAGMFSNGEDLTKIISKSLEESISSKVTAAINDLKKQLGLKPDEKDGKKGDDSTTGGDLETAGGAVDASELYKEIGAKLEQWDIYRNSVALIESNGSYTSVGGSGGHFDGRYQMGADAKTDGSKVAKVSDPGHGDKNSDARVSFRNNPKLQETLFTGFTVANHRYLMKNQKYKSANVERKLEILGYAHNQGMGGAETWMNTGQVGSDGFGTKGTKYTDLIAKNFRAKKSGGVMELATGAIPVPTGDETGLSGKAGKIIAGAKRILGLEKGVGDGCARTTRAALVAGGLSEFKSKTTQIGDLDVPVGYSIGNTQLAGSFGGSDLGKVIRNKSNIKAGDIILWRGGTGYDSGAITHVGIAADDGLKNQYDHNTGSGFHYRPHWDSAKGRKWFAGVRLMSEGGMIDKPSLAIFSEKGRKEFLLGGKVTELFTSIDPNFLKEVNATKTKQQLMKILQSYAPYEQSYPNEVFIPILIPVPTGGGGNSSGSSGGTIIAMGGGSNPFDSLYKGG